MLESVYSFGEGKEIALDGLREMFRPRSIRGAVGLIAVSAIPLVLTVIALIWLSISVPEYSNKSVEQHQQDEAALADQYVEACTAAGHNWQDGQCLANYTQPDTSWYEEPVLNRTDVWIERIGPAMLIVSGLILLSAITYFADRERWYWS